jgi:hypothetical protein
MNIKYFIGTEAVSCLLTQDDLRSPLRLLAMQIANVARLPITNGR